MTNPHWHDLENLIVVAGHAIYTAEEFADPLADSSWCLREFQKGEPPFYIEHIRRAVSLAEQDGGALLVFSGGQTRLAAGPRSEGQSYWNLADHFGWWHGANVRPRATTEEYARDSFENVLFGLCRFFECVGRSPQRLTVVSWAFKRERFALHRDAINFPASRFEFEGVNDPVDLKRAIEGEAIHALAPFRSDPYGSTDPSLAGKRHERNPFHRQHPYLTSCPELAQLLRHKGPSGYREPLPWTRPDDSQA